MSSFNIDNIRISWEVDDLNADSCNVREMVEGMERCFVYGPVPKSEVEMFLDERKAIMSDMAKRFRKSKMN